MIRWLPSGAIDEHVMLADAARSIVADALGREGAPPTSASLAALAGHDLLAVGLPEADGGVGLAPSGALLVVQAVASVSASLGTIVADTYAAQRALASAARSARTDHPIGRPDDAIAVAAPAPGPLPARGRDAVALSRVELGPTTRWLLVADDRPEDPLLALRRLDEVGVSEGESIARTGLRGVRSTPIRVALAERDRSQGQATRRRCAVLALDLALAGRAAVALGVAQAAFAATVGYGTQRRQFGTRVLDFGANRERLATRAGELTAAIASLHEAAGTSALDGVLSRAALRRSAAAAFACAVGCAADAIQLHGGYGYVEEYAPAGLLRDALSLRAASGGVQALLTGATGDLLEAV